MNSNPQNLDEKRSTNSLEGEQKEPSTDRLEPEREPHPDQPRHISQEEMQKIMPPNPDPDDPQSR